MKLSLAFIGAVYGDATAILTVSESALPVLRSPRSPGTRRYFQLQASGHKSDRCLLKIGNLTLSCLRSHAATDPLQLSICNSLELCQKVDTGNG